MTKVTRKSCSEQTWKQPYVTASRPFKFDTDQQTQGLFYIIALAIKQAFRNNEKNN